VPDNKTAEANARLIENYEKPGVKNDWQPPDNRPTSDTLRGASTSQVTGQAVEHLIRQEQRYLPYNNNRTQLVMEATEDSISEFEKLQYVLSRPTNPNNEAINLTKVKTRCAESRTLFFPNHLTQPDGYTKTICKDLLPFAITTSEEGIKSGNEYDTQFTSDTQEKITLLRMKNEGAPLPDTLNLSGGARSSYIGGTTTTKLPPTEQSIGTINRFSRGTEFGLQTEPTGLAQEVIDQKLWSPKFNPIATPDKQIYFTAAFGYYRDKPKFARARFHKGVDLIRKAGLPIVSVDHGIVKRVVPPNPDNSKKLCIVVINHSKRIFEDLDNAISDAEAQGEPKSNDVSLRQNEEKIYNITTTYMHMFKLDERIKKGYKIKAGEIIGFAGGNPGWPGAGGTTGAHLHFEVAITAKNKKSPNGKFKGETTLSDMGHQKAGIPQVDPTFFKYPQIAAITKEQKEQYTKSTPTTSPKK